MAASHDPRTQPGAPSTPPPNLPPELAQHPRYQVLRELGRGGMGVVYHARQTMMDREVAIKVINKALLDNPDALERFQREVRAAAKLVHPNIVVAYDAERAGDLHMLVMEYVDGRSLADVLKKKGPLPLAQACHFVRQAALGLQQAHEHGMVHRDIKPHNLMVTARGQVKILDFGLAKVVSENRPKQALTAMNTYMGTPEYSAPEQAKDASAADIRADLYSLGCTLYCLLAGRPPFREDTDIKTILAHLEKEPPPLPGVPPELWAVLARLLAKDPARRYQKPAELAQALLPFCKAGSKEPITVAVASPGQATAAPGNTSPLPPARKAARPTGQSAAPTQPAPPPPTGRGWMWWLVGGGAATVLALAASGVLVALILPRLEPPGGTFHVSKTDPHNGAPLDGPKSPPPPPPPAGPAAPPAADRLALSNGKGRWRVEGGELVQVGNDPDVRLFFGHPAWQDYDFSAEALRSAGNEDLALVFRAEDEQNAFWMGLGAQNNQYHVLGSLDAGKPTSVRRVDGSVQSDRWYTLLARVRGQHVQGFLDGRPVFDVMDARHGRGRVGLRGSAGGVRFRNLKVTTPDGQVLWEGLPDIPSAVQAPPDRPASVAGTPPPVTPGYVALFNGRDLTGWARLDGRPAGWRVLPGGVLETVPGAGHIMTTRAYGPDLRLHAEFRIPLMADRRGQARGNSGIFLLGRHEVQIVDDVNNDVGPPPTQCGALFGLVGPSRHVTRPPGQWQEFDIEYHGLRLNAAGQPDRPGRITVVFNGTRVIDDAPFTAPFTNQVLPATTAPTGPIVLQEHGAAVQFRKLEIQELADTGPPTGGATAEGDPIREKLDRARAAYKEEMARWRQAVLDDFDRREKVARKDGFKNVLDQLTAERDAFTRTDEPPPSLPPSLRRQYAAARLALEAALRTAVKEYTKANRDREAAALEAELKLQKGQDLFPLAKYRVTYNNGVKGTTELLGNNAFHRVLANGRQNRGTYELTGGKLVLRCQLFVEVWTIVGGKTVVEHWNPADTYPSPKPRFVGEAVRE